MEILVHFYLVPGLGMTGAVPPILHLTSRRVYTQMYTHIMPRFQHSYQFRDGIRYTEKRDVMESTARLRSSAEVKIVKLGCSCYGAPG